MFTRTRVRVLSVGNSSSTNLKVYVIVNDIVNSVGTIHSISVTFYNSRRY
jgi:hypothetical protein